MPLGIEDSYFSMLEGLSCERDIKIDRSVPLEVDLVGNKTLLLNTGRYFFMNPKWTELHWAVVLRVSHVYHQYPMHGWESQSSSQFTPLCVKPKA